MQYIFYDEGLHGNNPNSQQDNDDDDEGMRGPQDMMGMDKDDGMGLGDGDLRQEKDLIRDIVTPNIQGNELLSNDEGRSAFNGAVLKVVSLNHKNQSKDPVFKKFGKGGEGGGMQQINEEEAE